MSRRRIRSTAYRARRRVRAAQRRNRESERRDYQYILENTPGYAAMLERFMEEERAEELAMEWEAV